MTAPDVAALAAALVTVEARRIEAVSPNLLKHIPGPDMALWAEHAEAIIAALAAQKVKLATPDSIYAALEATMIGYNTEQRKLWAEAIWEWMNG